jgi:hypothetical protein
VADRPEAASAVRRVDPNNGGDRACHLRCGEPHRCLVAGALHRVPALVRPAGERGCPDWGRGLPARIATSSGDDLVQGASPGTPGGLDDKLHGEPAGFGKPAHECRHALHRSKLRAQQPLAARRHPSSAKAMLASANGADSRGHEGGAAHRRRTEGAPRQGEWLQHVGPARGARARLCAGPRFAAAPPCVCRRAAARIDPVLVVPTLQTHGRGGGSTRASDGRILPVARGMDRTRRGNRRRRSTDLCPPIVLVWQPGRCLLGGSASAGTGSWCVACQGERTVVAGCA